MSESPAVDAPALSEGLRPDEPLVRRRRRSADVICWLSVVPFAVWAVVRVAGIEIGTLPIQLLAFTPYAALAAVVPLALTLLTRRWVAAAVAGLALVALTACVLPRAFGSSYNGPGYPFVVMSINMRVGAADPRSIVDLVRDRHVDVLTVQEYTAASRDGLAAAGLDALLPFGELHPVEGVEGSAIYSRLPLRDGAFRLMPGGFGQASAVVEIAGAGPVAVESVHPIPPINAISLWADGISGQTPATVDGPPRVLSGDFNSTLDHAVLRELLGTGYRDAAAEVGRALTPTWPYYGPRSAVTPGIAIDHVLVNGDTGVLDFDAVTVPLTDHRAIIATLILPAP